MLDQTGREVRIQNGILLYDQNWVGAIGATRVEGVLPSGTEVVLKGIREQETNSGLGFRKINVRRVVEDAAQLFYGPKGSTPCYVKPKAIACRRGGRPVHTLTNEARWSGVKRSSRAGVGEAVAAAAARRESETAETMDTSLESIIRKTSMGARLEGAWATPRRSPGSSSAAPTRGRRPGAWRQRSVSLQKEGQARAII